MYCRVTNLNRNQYSSRPMARPWPIAATQAATRRYWKWRMCEDDGIILRAKRNTPHLPSFGMRIFIIVKARNGAGIFRNFEYYRFRSADGMRIVSARRRHADSGNISDSDKCSESSPWHRLQLKPESGMSERELIEILRPWRTRGILDFWHGLSTLSAPSGGISENREQWWCASRRLLSYIVNKSRRQA